MAGSKGKALDKDSEQWKTFEAMQERIRHAVESSQQKISKMSDFDEELEKLTASSASNSPWGVEIPPHPSEVKEDASFVSPLEQDIVEAEAPKIGWVGFDDNFGQSTAAAHVSVSPVPSPRHEPVPPNNSRRDSGEGDLLGLMNGEAGTTDLLGLDKAEPAETVQDTAASYTSQILALSRNLDIDEGAKSSGASTPPADADVTDNTQEQAEQLTGAAISIVDDFLGISGQEIQKPVDPLAELMSKKEKSVDKDDEKPQAMGDDFGIGTAVPDTVDDDDPFGLGALQSKPAEQTSVPEVKGDLFIVEKDDKVEDEFTIPEEVKKIAQPVLSPCSDDFDPRADISVDAAPAADIAPTPTPGQNKVYTRPRPRPRPSAQAKPANPFNLELYVDESAVMYEEDEDAGASGTVEGAFNPFTSEGPAGSKNPFAAETAGGGHDLIADDTSLGLLGDNVSAAQAVSGGAFNPFATITEPDTGHHHNPAHGEDFDPFQTIHGDDAFDVQFPSNEEDKSPSRFNPFDKEPPLDEKFASVEPQIAKPDETKQAEGSMSPQTVQSESSVEEEEEHEPLEEFIPKFEGDGWHLLLRQPTKKKLTQNRFWKPVYVRVASNNNIPVIKVFNNDKDAEVMQELQMQPSYNLCDLGLQQYDHFTKCHTVKIQYVFYRERVGVKAERIAPTLSDLTRVRDLKGLKDLVHRPKATMILDHAPQTSELLKFGGLNYEEFSSFIHFLEDAMFQMDVRRDKSLQYTKDEITVDIVDEYFVEIDGDGHITSHKARVRVFCLAFLTGNPTVELGVNDKRRRGKEVVGRQDIIPIKTEEWIRIYEPTLHCSVSNEEFEKTKIIQLKPLDACHFEVMRFRVFPRLNRELPLQVRIQMSVINRKVEIRGDIMIPGYYSNSRRAQQTPCEDIQIRIPIPEPWIYLFRVEKRFRYGSVKSSTRKAGKIKGLERLTMMAQGMLPPSLIEVSSGQAKYEHIFHSIVWRISRLPERNQGK